MPHIQVSTERVRPLKLVIKWIKRLIYLTLATVVLTIAWRATDWPTEQWKKLTSEPQKNSAVVAKGKTGEELSVTNRKTIKITADSQPSRLVIPPLCWTRWSWTGLFKWCTPDGNCGDNRDGKPPQGKNVSGNDAIYDITNFEGDDRPVEVTVILTPK